MIQRHLSNIIENITQKLVLLAGPRQVGKTWLSTQLLQEFQCEKLYFNWDTPDVKKQYLRDPTFFEAEAKQSSKPTWIVLDEIHKRDDWKELLKGYYDQYRNEFQFLVTGSARLDLFHQSGDSLLGRYLMYHLLPVSLSELNNNKAYIYDLKLTAKQNLERILDYGPAKNWEERFKFSGFPEPLCAQKDTSLNLWNRTYEKVYFHEELRDLTRIRSLSKAEDLGLLLTTKIGSPLSKSSLAKDINASFDVVDAYLKSLEKIYYLFSLQPFSKKIQHSLKKDRKFYLFNDSLIDEPAKRYENIVANHLLRAITYWNDIGAGSFSLKYIRDNNKKECDFLLLQKEKPLILIEAKLGKPDSEPHLIRFSKLLETPLVIVTNLKNYNQKDGNCYKVSAAKFLAGLP